MLPKSKKPRSGDAYGISGDGYMRELCLDSQSSPGGRAQAPLLASLTLLGCWSFKAWADQPRPGWAKGAASGENRSPSEPDGVAV